MQRTVVKRARQPRHRARHVQKAADPEMLVRRVHTGLTNDKAARREHVASLQRLQGDERFAEFWCIDKSGVQPSPEVRHVSVEPQLLSFQKDPHVLDQPLSGKCTRQPRAELCALLEKEHHAIAR